MISERFYSFTFICGASHNTYSLKAASQNMNISTLLLILIWYHSRNDYTDHAVFRRSNDD